MTIMAAVLESLGAWLPPRVITNDDLFTRLGRSTEWIKSRTGVVERRNVSAGMASGDLAVEAGARALKAAGRSAVDAVVVATCSPDRIIPATAPDVAARLGLDAVAAFDLAAACGGFVYGLAACAGLIAAEVADTILFVGAEAMSTVVNPMDEMTAPIFGDGAGAVVLRRGRADELGAFGVFDLGSDGVHSNLLAVPAGGSRQRSATGLGHDTVPADDWYLQMSGNATYRHAVTRMSTSARSTLDRVGWAIDSVDRFIGHQANARILAGVAKRLGIAEERLVINVGRVGNTAAASIPLAMADAASSGELQPGHRVLLTAFGAGLCWGSTVLTWPDISVERPM
jgi:3-oxoacyl-[acyl-carrier-protein] synthase-3